VHSLRHVQGDRPACRRPRTRVLPRPTAAAAYVGRATAGGTGKVRFKISDPRPCSEACKARITITTLKGKRLGYLAPDVWFRTGRYITVQFACPLKAGKYRFVVKGMDGADNTTARTAGNYLVVSKSRTVSRGTSSRVWEFRPPGERAPFAPAARAVTLR